MTPPPKAVLFDVDGTLVDSNYLHVAAWMTAFSEAGVAVDAARIHRDIGMDSGQLLADLLGERADDLGEQVKDAHSRAYEAQAHLLRPFAGARELLAELRHRGITVVLATSAPPEELALLRRTLNADDSISAETNADDVEQAKPDPGIVQVALERAGCTADEAVFVGDAVWDMRAAHKVGVTCLGVLTGGLSRLELLDSGADAVYEDVAAIHQALAADRLFAAGA